MKSLRWITGSLAISCLVTWLFIGNTATNRAYAVTPVVYTAFAVPAVGTNGQPLDKAAAAAKARAWPDVAAVSFNAKSSTLAVSHHANVDAKAMETRLSALVGAPVTVKQFGAAAGKCPIPHELFTQAPMWFLMIGLASSLAFLTVTLRRGSPPSQLESA